MLNKKVIALVAAAALAACLGLAGCGGSQVASSSAAASNTAASASASASDTAASASAAAASATAASSNAAPASTTAASPAAAPATNSYIGDQAALDIALADAGFSAADVFGLEVELDLDSAVVHYDVNFKQGNLEYDYDIDATTGAIVQARSEIDD
ncbi:MAG: PepSY domain-containing protein [Eggerthellaceae bacterium]|nr:PepSY domain-containing protein [Eggerthellaceae bacterium]